MLEIRKLSLLIVAIMIITVNSVAWTGEVIKSYVIPGDFPTGLTFDGENIWLADYKTDMLYCINPETGDVIRDLPAPAYWPEGLAWDGEALWNVDIKGGIPLSENYAGMVYRIDPENGNLLKTIPAPSNSPRGLTWDGKYLWCVDNRADEVIQFDPDDGTTIRSFKSPASDPRGITFDGTYLWVSDRITNEIFMVDPKTGTVLITTDAPGEFTRGLCFDGKNLWAIDYQEDKLFKLKVRDGEKYRRYNPRTSKVIYSHMISNFGPGKINNADIYLAIPENRPNQDIIGGPRYSTSGNEKVKDKWGLEMAHFNFKNIQAGEDRIAEMITEAKLYEVRHFIFPDKVGSLNDIPGDIRSLYLENNEKYQFEHPVIQEAIKIALDGETNPYWMARKIFNYLIDNMYYEMTGGWNTAPTVLERGNGSCSEYSFVYISMCRAAGIPAKYVGSVVVRGDEASMDDVFHRWVEIYLPNYGWIPVDPSGGDRDRPRDQAEYFGHLANRFLITTESGGGSKMMEWTYNSNAFWVTEPKTFVVSDHFAEWEPLNENKKE